MDMRGSEQLSGLDSHSLVAVALNFPPMYLLCLYKHVKL